MRFNKLSLEITNPKATLTALVLTVTMICSGYACNTNTNVQKWLDILQKDLPILVQMAGTIAQIVPLVGIQVSPDVVTSVNDIGEEAKKDTALIQELYSAYKSDPTADNKRRLEEVMATTVTRLPELLNAAHIKDPDLLQKVKAAVGIVVGTINTILMLMPDPTTSVAIAVHKKKTAKMTPPTPEVLKQQWKDQVGVPLASQ